MWRGWRPLSRSDESDVRAGTLREACGPRCVGSPRVVAGGERLRQPWAAGSDAIELEDCGGDGLSNRANPRILATCCATAEVSWPAGHRCVLMSLLPLHIVSSQLDARCWPLAQRPARPPVLRSHHTRPPPKGCCKSSQKPRQPLQADSRRAVGCWRSSSDGRRQWARRRAAACGPTL